MNKLILTGGGISVILIAAALMVTGVPENPMAILDGGNDNSCWVDYGESISGSTFTSWSDLEPVYQNYREGVEQGRFDNEYTTFSEWVSAAKNSGDYRKHDGKIQYQVKCLKGGE